MGELFDKLLKSDESIFLNPQFLDFDYQPKIVPCREGEQQEIASHIKPLLQRRNGTNMIIIGSPGVGKTVTLRHVLDELKEDWRIAEYTTTNIRLKNESSSGGETEYLYFTKN